MKRFALPFFLLLIHTALSAQPAGYTGRDANPTSRTTNVWTGATSTAWGIATNWSLGHVPQTAEDVGIPSSLSNYPIIGTGSRSCNGLGIASGASLTIAAGGLTIATDCIVQGSLTLNNAASVLTVNGNLSFDTNSSAAATAAANLYIQGSLNCESLSTIDFASANLTFQGSGTSYILTDSPVTVANLVINKTAGQAATFDATSNSTLTINGNLTVNGGSTLNHPDSGTTYLKGNLTVASGGACHFTAGTLSLEGSSATDLTFTDAGSYLNHLTIEKSGGINVNLLSYLDVNGNLTISNGFLISNSQPISVGGNWNNPAGAGNFLEGTSTVTLDGSLSGTISTEFFYTLRLDKNAATMSNLPGSTVSAQYYDWENGNLTVNGGLVVLQNLLDPGIYGNVTVTAGNLELYQNAATNNLCGNFSISGGSCEIYSPNAYLTVGSASAASFTVSGGTLDISGPGLRIWSGYTLTAGLTGGTIRLNGNFDCSRNDFTPSGACNMEFYGSVNKAVTFTYPASSHMPGLIVNKGTGRLTQCSGVRYFGNLTISSGNLYASGNWELKGNFTNNAGSGGLTGFGTLTLNGSGVTQYISGRTTFDKVVESITGGSLDCASPVTFSQELTLNHNAVFHDSLTVNGNFYNDYATVINLYGGHNRIHNYYGPATLNLPAGVYLLVDNFADTGGMRGIYNVSGGHLVGTLADNMFGGYLDGSLIITQNGIVELTNGIRFPSQLPSFDFLLSMDSGELILHGSLTMLNNTSPCNIDITGGKITTGDFADYKGVFDPAGGTVEIAGSDDASIYPHNSSWFHNLVVYLPGHNLDIYNSATCHVRGSLTIQQVNTCRVWKDLELINYGTGESVNLAIAAGNLQLYPTVNLTVSGTTDIHGTLTMDNACVFSCDYVSVQSGGTLNTSCTTGNVVGNYLYSYCTINIENGGTLAAGHTQFYDLGPNGIFLKPGSTVDAANSLNYCTFYGYPSVGANLLTLNNSQDITITSAKFPSNIWNGAHNACKTVNGGSVNFINASGGYSGAACEQDPYGRINWISAGPDITAIEYLPATNSIRLTWAYDYGQTPIGYNIYRAASSDGPFTLAGTTSSTTWSEVLPGTHCLYRVTALLP